MRDTTGPQAQSCSQAGQPTGHSAGLSEARGPMERFRPLPFPGVVCGPFPSPSLPTGRQLCHTSTLLNYVTIFLGATALGSSPSSMKVPLGLRVLIWNPGGELSAADITSGGCEEGSHSSRDTRPCKRGLCRCGEGAAQLRRKHPPSP